MATLRKITFNGQAFGVELVADTDYVSEKISRTASTETVLETLVNLILSMLHIFFGVEYDIFSVTTSAMLREHRLSWTKRLSLSLATCWRRPDGYHKQDKGCLHHVRHSLRNFLWHDNQHRYPSSSTQQLLFVACNCYRGLYWRTGRNHNTVQLRGICSVPQANVGAVAIHAFRKGA